MSATTTTLPPCQQMTTTPSPTNSSLFDGAGDDEITTGAIAIFGIFAVLLFAAFLERIKSKNPVPFTICMIFFGSILGGIAHVSPQFDTDLLFTEMNPMDILNIFLPILIFDGAFNLKLSTLAKVTFGSVVLAGPGVVLNSFMMAGVAMGLYPNWNLAEALLFGSIVSATDPVAVIARLKDLDADRWTTTLTDGEAIMNDGTAVVLFEMLRGAVRRNAEKPDFGEVILSILRYCGVPVPLGLLCGFIISYCERRSPTKPIVVTIVQLSGAYVAYFLAANVIGTSTVLTLMVMAVYMAAQKASYPKGDYDHVVHQFWEVLVWIANALIFALVGIISIVHVINELNGSEIWRIIVIYIVINVARGIMLLLAWPLINYNVEREADRMNWRRWAMLTYGGLRGGIALLLGLAVLQEKRNDPVYGAECFAQVAGIVLLTSIVNGWTAGPVVSWLGLDAKANFSHHAILQAVEEIKATANVRLMTHKLSENDVFFIDWGFVMEKTVGQIQPPTNRLYSYAPTMTRSGAKDSNAPGSSREEAQLADQSTAEMQDRTPRAGGFEPMSPTSSDYEDRLLASARGTTIDRSRQLLDYLERSPSAEVMIPILLRVMKRELWRMFDAALIAGRTISVLENFFETNMSDRKLFTADDLHEYLISPDRFAGFDYKLRGLMPFQQCDHEQEREELIVTGSIAFHRIMQRIHQGITVLYGSVSGTQAWLEWAKTVMDHAEDLSVMIRVDHPRVARIVDSRRVAQEILGEAQESVDTIALLTGLTGKQRQWLYDKLFRLTFLVSQETPPALISDHELIQKVFNESKIVETCSESEREKLWNARKICSASQDEDVRLEPGTFGIVVSGRITQKGRFTMQTISNVSTDYFGLSYNIRGLDSSTLKIKAECSCAFLAFPFTVLEEIMKVNEAAREAVYRRESAVVIEPLLSQIYPSCSLSPFQRKLLVEHAELVFISNENRHPVFKRVHGPASPTSSSSASSPSSPLSVKRLKEGDYGTNQSIFLLRGSSENIPSPQHLTVIPETVNTRWNVGSVLLVLHDFALAKQLVPVTGIFFLDRAHVQIDIMLTSFLEASGKKNSSDSSEKQSESESASSSSAAHGAGSSDMLLFTFDRLLFALTEYIPSAIVVVHLLEQSQNPHLEESRALIHDLITHIGDWIFLRHMGGIEPTKVIKQVEHHFDVFVRKAETWSLQLVPWCKANLNKNNAAGGSSNDDKSLDSWSFSPFNTLSQDEIEDLAKKKYNLRIPIRKSFNLFGQESAERMAASTSETVFVSEKEY